MSAPKAIVLFSDGTGNSSAKLFKTNVWRMYEAIDLGPSPEGQRDQISYYDDGVGTSAFRPLAMLGGLLGYGLKRNVLDLYRYACRNYREGDEIYAFGFSRGAFTIRLVVALIAAQGLVRSESEAQLDRKSVAAYRAFRSGLLPRRLHLPTRVARALRDLVLRLLGRTPSSPAANVHPVLRFVGVWDTVSAYGGPITEITRAIDNWIFPLSMPNYQLNTKVKCARHALALDDERDAFQPLLWDEVWERQLIEEGEHAIKEGRAPEVTADRLQQVWFTGVHSDVGGGYPDESLSYVSLLWMMEEAERAGLRTLEVIKQRFIALASSYGPLHDSRGGVGAYYRYQPRKIAAWLDPVDERTLALRDPTLRDGRGQPAGLLRSVKVHESVINRIVNGTDRYAPITLPKTFDIVPPQREGENAAQATNEQPALEPRERVQTRPLVSSAVRTRVTEQSTTAARATAIEAIWDLVWWRRVTYFATLLFTLLLLSLPLLEARLPSAPLLRDGRTWIGRPIRLLSLALPDFAGRWVEVYADNPFYFLLLLLVIYGLLKTSGFLERRLRDKARRAWAIATPAPVAGSRPSSLERFRNSTLYQRSLQLLKWRVFPDGVFAPLIAALLAWLLIATFTQLRLPFVEGSDVLCRPIGRVDSIIHSRSDFRTRDVCSESIGTVAQNERYVVTFEVVEPWQDAIIPTSPMGLTSGDFPWGLGYLAAPFRRVIDAHYLQPVFEIRSPEDATPWWDVVDRRVRIHRLAVQPVAGAPAFYRAEIEAPVSGELFLFANDAMIPLIGRWWWGPLNYRFFYEASGATAHGAGGNHGTACVTVQRADALDAPPALPRAGSVCDASGRQVDSRPPSG